MEIVHATRAFTLGTFTRPKLFLHASGFGRVAYFADCIIEENQNVAISLYHNRTLFIQGKGCSTWKANVFDSIVKPLSSPTPLKQLSELVTSVRNLRKTPAKRTDQTCKKQVILTDMTQKSTNRVADSLNKENFTEETTQDDSTDSSQTFQKSVVSPDSIRDNKKKGTKATQSASPKERVTMHKNTINTNLKDLTTALSTVEESLTSILSEIEKLSDNVTKSTQSASNRQSQQNDLGKKMKEIHELTASRFKHTNQLFDSVHTKLNILDGKVKMIDGTQDKVNSRLDKIESNMTNIIKQNEEMVEMISNLGNFLFKNDGAEQRNPSLPINPGGNPEPHNTVAEQTNASYFSCPDRNLESHNAEKIQSRTTDAESRHVDTNIQQPQAGCGKTSASPQQTASVDTDQHIVTNEEVVLISDDVDNDDRTIQEHSDENQPVSCDLLVLTDSMLNRLNTRRFSRSHKVIKCYVKGGIRNCCDFIESNYHKYSPKKILLHTGTNDLNTENPSSYKLNLQNLLSKAKCKWSSAQIYLSSIIPRLDANNKRVSQANKIAGEICKQCAVEFINNSHVINTYRGSPNKDLFFDHIHLNDHSGLPKLIHHLKDSLGLNKSGKATQGGDKFKRNIRHTVNECVTENNEGSNQSIQRSYETQAKTRPHPHNRHYHTDDKDRPYSFQIHNSQNTLSNQLTPQVNDNNVQISSAQIANTDSQRQSDYTLAPYRCTSGIPNYPFNIAPVSNSHQYNSNTIQLPTNLCALPYNLPPRHQAYSQCPPPPHPWLQQSWQYQPFPSSGNIHSTHSMDNSNPN